MSIQVMNYVWENSEQTGTDLLMLLAIADHANDEGICWPSIERLARKARVDRRQAQRIVKKLEASGELTVDRGTGRGHTSLYIVKGDMAASPFTEIKGDIQGQRVTSRVIKGDIAMSPRTISNHHIEPSTTVAQKRTPPAPRSAFVLEVQSVLKQNPSKAQVPLIDNAVTDLELWRKVLTMWAGKGWNPRNIAGMIDLYQHPERMTYKNGANHNGTNRQDVEEVDDYDPEFAKRFAEHQARVREQRAAAEAGVSLQ